VEHEPTERALDHPPAWQNPEAFGARVAVHDFDVDAQFGAVLDDFRVVAAVHTRLSNARSSLGGVVEDLPADRGVA
jgi:hypothetical protein